MEDDRSSSSDSGGNGSGVDDEESGSEAEDVQAFDIRLPVTHPYLHSSQLGEISATASLYADPGGEITVPALVTDAVLLPGQTLPLHFIDARCIEFLSEAARKRQYIALLISKMPDPDEDARGYLGVASHEVGTLFQIQNASQSDGEGNARNGRNRQRLTIQAVGRQRCRLLAPLRNFDVLCEEYAVAICDKVRVEVMEEEELPSFFRPLDASSLNRLPRSEVELSLLSGRTNSIVKLIQRNKWLAALYHPLPYAIELCSTASVVAWLKRWLERWFDPSRIDVIAEEQGTTAFSYWVASNLPVNLVTKMELLSERSTDRRLKREWRIACGMTRLACVMCDDIKCEVEDLINLNAEGNGCYYVNPHGCLHDLFTVASITNVEAQGAPSTEFSWFPGYAWTILYCSTCQQHLGWRFTSSKLAPRHFFGITRRAFKLTSGAPE